MTITAETFLCATVLMFAWLLTQSRLFWALIVVNRNLHLLVKIMPRKVLTTNPAPNIFRSHLSNHFLQWRTNVFFPLLDGWIFFYITFFLIVHLCKICIRRLRNEFGAAAVGRLRTTSFYILWRSGFLLLSCVRSLKFVYQSSWMVLQDFLRHIGLTILWLFQALFVGRYQDTENFAHFWKFDCSWTGCANKNLKPMKRKKTNSWVNVRLTIFVLTQINPQTSASFNRTQGCNRASSMPNNVAANAKRY